MTFIFTLYFILKVNCIFGTENVQAVHTLITTVFCNSVNSPTLQYLIMGFDEIYLM